MPINLTENAAKEIKSIISEQGLPAEKTRLRVGVKGGGCSGYSYMLDLVEDEPNESDVQSGSRSRRGCRSCATSARCCTSRTPRSTSRTR
jgi:iron-sulfur cluster assembly protein